MDESEQMRNFILVTEALMESYARGHFTPEPVEEEVIVEEEGPHPILTDLHDIVFRLRAFMETEGGDYALGVETGMQRAAEMIENLIKRYEGERQYLG